MGNTAASTLRAASIGRCRVASFSRCAYRPVICRSHINARVAGNRDEIEAAVCSIAPAVLEGTRNAQATSSRTHSFDNASFVPSRYGSGSVAIAASISVSRASRAARCRRIAANNSKREAWSTSV